MLSANTASEDGGGALNENGANLTIDRSTLVGNAAVRYGGGLRNNGVTILTNCTLSGNKATGAAGSGGGAYNASSGTLTLLNTTNTGNVAVVNGGGIFVSGTVNAKNTIVSGNAASSGPDIEGAVVSQGTT